MNIDDLLKIPKTIKLDPEINKELLDDLKALINTRKPIDIDLPKIPWDMSAGFVYYQYIHGIGHTSCQSKRDLVI